MSAEAAGEANVSPFNTSCHTPWRKKLIVRSTHPSLQCSSFPISPRQQPTSPPRNATSSNCPLSFVSGSTTGFSRHSTSFKTRESTLAFIDLLSSAHAVSFATRLSQSIWIGFSQDAPKPSRVLSTPWRRFGTCCGRLEIIAEDGIPFDVRVSRSSRGLSDTSASVDI